MATPPTDDATQVFGETRASFVFAVRHPFGGCPGKGFRDPRQCARAAERLKWWLAANETLFKDLDAFARRAAVIQLERLVADPVETLGALADVLAIEDHETLAFRFKRGGEARSGARDRSGDRGDAAGATWIFRGGALGRRRQCRVDIPWRNAAATPRVPRGYSVEARCRRRRECRDWNTSLRVGGAAGAPDGDAAAPRHLARHCRCSKRSSGRARRGRGAGTGDAKG